MPAVTLLSEFNRDQGAVIAQLAETKEPLYLTRNGKSSVVVMDAEPFDRAVSYKEEIRTREMDVLRGLMLGYQDVLDGKTVEAGDAFHAYRGHCSVFIVDNVIQRERSIDNRYASTGKQWNRHKISRAMHATQCWILREQIDGTIHPFKNSFAQNMFYQECLCIFCKTDNVRHDYQPRFEQIWSNGARETPRGDLPGCAKRNP